MEKRPLSLFLILGFFCAPSFLFSQQANPYIINGSAYQENCNCYTLTNDQTFQSGSVWNKNKIDLTQSFDFKFTVYLGCHDNDGADGIAFVLQPLGTSIGNTGQGIGFQGVHPSVGIPIDTWQNPDFNDPPYDHIGIYKNGNLNNSSPDVMDGPVAALQGNANIEDCNWHEFRITWEAGTHRLSAYIDGLELVHTTVDIITDIFGGDPNVFWGFTGATGGGTNRQRFCTSLTPLFSIPTDQKTCYPTPIVVNDNSSSFGSIVKWYWNWGDGTIDSVQNPPAHVYPSPGIYEAKLNIIGNNGCLSDTFRQKIVVGSKPFASFGYGSMLPCANVPIQIIDSSYVKYGTLNNWTWDINNGQQTVSGSLNQKFPPGVQTISLVVSSAEGCVSDPVSHSIEIFPYPTTTMQLENACYGDPVKLEASNADPSVNIEQWYWQLGDGSKDSSSSIVHVYAKEGEFPVNVVAKSDQGCFSDTLSGIVNIYRTYAFAGNDTVVAIGQPLQLHGSGGVLYQWQPAFGLSDPSIADPIAVLQNDAQYVLTAYTDVGCPTSDTISIKAYKGPAIYGPSAFTPNNDGHNDKFRCIAVGMSTFDFFNVYNRYGQLLYTSRDSWQGWDGNYNGKPQPMGTYVWMARGTDYKGNVHLEKGTVTLIR